MSGGQREYVSDLTAERDRLEADLERLKVEYSNLAHGNGMEITRLEAEVERMRRKIERVRDQVKSGHFKHDDLYLIEALSAALRPPK